MLPDRYADGYRTGYELERLWLAHLRRSGNSLNRGERPLSRSALRRATEQVHFTFAYATAEDAECVHDVIVRAAAGVAADQFVVNDLETIAR